MVTKVWGDAIQLVSSAISGIVIAFVYSWRLSLVLLCAMPFVLGAAALEARVHQVIFPPFFTLFQKNSSTFFWFSARIV